MRTLIVIMGVSGAGKSTIGSALAEKMHRSFLEGDDFHPKANVEKMASGAPLTNQDRKAWIDAMGIAIAASKNETLILSCSALNEFVRTRLTETCGRKVVWVYLHLTRGALFKRLQNRQGHFMKADMLDSQLDAMHPPAEAIRVDGDQTIDVITADIIDAMTNIEGTHTL
jgi:gluconokinase